MVKSRTSNREEKEVVSSVSQAAGAFVVGGMAANSSQGIGVGLTTAKNAVENNLLSKNEDEELSIFQKSLKKQKS